MSFTYNNQEAIPLSAPDIGDAERAAVLRVLSTAQLCMGPEMHAFEREFANRIGVDDAITVSSGTAALHLALVTLGIHAGDEVIIPSFAFVAVVNVLLQIGAIPVFAEIDEFTLNLSPTAVEAVLTPRTRAIIVVHTFGIPAEISALQAICMSHSLFLIEDACEALGAKIGTITDNQPVGSFGHASVFGFYPNKQITTGEGGMLILANSGHATRARKLRNQGRAENEWEPGFNYRLSEIACALGRVQLSRLDEILTLRRQAAERYHVLLSELSCIELPPLQIPNATISWFVYVIRLATTLNRAALQQSLANSGIATTKYFEPIHQSAFLQNHRCARNLTLPITERISKSVLALPFFNRITVDQQSRIVQALAQSIK